MNAQLLYPITTSKLVLLDNNKTLKLNLGSANGIATLNNKGKIPASQLPDSLADITEYNNTVSGLEAETVQEAIDELALRPAGSAFTLKVVETLPTEDIDPTTIYLKLEITSASWYSYIPQSGWIALSYDDSPPVLFVVDTLPETPLNEQEYILYNNLESTWTYYYYEDGEWYRSTSGVIGDPLHDDDWTLIIVDKLPDNPDTSVSYLLLNKADFFDEYLYTGGHWEVIGSTQAALANCIAKDEFVAIVNTLPSEGEAGTIYCIPRTVTATKYSQLQTYLGSDGYQYADPVKLTETLTFKLVATLPEIGETDINYIWWDGGWKRSYYTDHWVTTSFGTIIKDLNDTTLTYYKSTSSAAIAAIPAMVPPTVGQVFTSYWYQLDSERLYDEYIYIDKHFEPIQLDLSSYAKQDEVVSKEELLTLVLDIWTEVAELPEITYKEETIQSSIEYDPPYDDDVDYFLDYFSVSEGVYYGDLNASAPGNLNNDDYKTWWYEVSSYDDETGEEYLDTVYLEAPYSLFELSDTAHFMTVSEFELYKDAVIQQIEEWYDGYQNLILLRSNTDPNSVGGSYLYKNGELISGRNIDTPLDASITTVSFPIYYTTNTSTLVKSTPIPPEHSWYKIKNNLQVEVVGSDYEVKIISDDSEIDSSEEFIYFNYINETATLNGESCTVIYGVRPTDFTSTTPVLFYTYTYDYYMYSLDDGTFKLLLYKDPIIKITAKDLYNLPLLDVSKKYLVIDYGQFDLVFTPKSVDEFYPDVTAVANSLSRSWDLTKWKINADISERLVKNNTVVMIDSLYGCYWVLQSISYSSYPYLNYSGNYWVLLKSLSGDYLGLYTIVTTTTPTNNYSDLISDTSGNSDSIYFLRYQDSNTYEIMCIGSHPMSDGVSYTAYQTYKYVNITPYAAEQEYLAKCNINRLIDEYNNSIPWDFKSLPSVTINVPYALTILNSNAVKEIYSDPYTVNSLYVWTNEAGNRWVYTDTPTATGSYTYTATQPSSTVYTAGAANVTVLSTDGTSNLTYTLSSDQVHYTLGYSEDTSLFGESHDVLIEDNCDTIYVKGTATNIIFKLGINNFTITGNISNIIFESNPVSELTLTYTDTQLMAYPNNFARELMNDSLETRLALHNVGDKTTYEGVTYIKRQETNYFVPYMTSNNTTVYAYVVQEPSSTSEYQYLVSPLSKFYTQPSLDSPYYIYEFTEPDYDSGLISVDSTDTTNSTGSDSSYILSSENSDYFTHQQINGQDYITQTTYYWEQVDATKYITASTYKLGTVYKLGDYCIILGELYKCTETPQFNWWDYEQFTLYEVGQDSTSIYDGLMVRYKDILFEFMDESYDDRILGDLSLSELRSALGYSVTHYFTKVTSLDDNTVYKIVLNENEDHLDLPALPTLNKEGLFIQITNTTTSNISVNAPYTKWINSQPSNIYATNESTVNICALDNICTLNYIIETT